MQINELREKTDVELDRLLADLRNKVMDQRFAIASGQLAKVREVRDAKRTIARILTLKKSRAAVKAK